MQKIIYILSLFFIIPASSAWSNTNPFFGDYKQQITFNVAQGIDSGIIVPPPFRLVPFYLLHVQYSQPTEFFTLPARKSVNIVQTIGFGEKYEWHWDRFTIPMILLSEDVAFFHGKDWYTGAGLGVGMQAQQNARIGSKLIFGFKLFAGFEITENINLELFMQHFSNGNTAPANYSYAFYGMGIVYKF